MPWCAGCDRFLSPSTVTPDGTCPRCGRPVDPGAARAPAPVPAPLEASKAADPAAGDEVEPMALPWHFKLLVAAIALYLGWRAFQGVEWLAGRF